MKDGGRRYRLIGLLGKGGFGSVYRARHEDGDGFVKDVAIKLLDAEHPSTETLQRFRDEARILGLVRHPGVVSVAPPVRLDGQWAVIMDYADGQSLAALAKPLPPPIALALVGQVAQILSDLWVQEGPTGEPLHIIHRDIKPANIQLSANGHVRLLDFGLARGNFSAREAQTQRHIGGTPGYIAPERLQGQELPAGDVFSLGVLLEELATGERRGPVVSSDAAESPATINIDLEAPEADHCGADPEMDPLIRLARSMRLQNPGDRPSARSVAEQCAQLSPSPTALRGWAQANIRPEALEANAQVGRTLQESQSSGSSGAANRADEIEAHTPRQALGGASRGKMGLWLLCTGWVPLLFAHPMARRLARDMTPELFGIPGIGDLVLLLLAGSALAVIWRLARVWRGEPWQSDSAFYSAMAAGLLVFVYQYTRHAAQLEGFMVGIHNYVEPAEGAAIQMRLAMLTGNYLSTTALLSMWFGGVCCVVLIAVLFAGTQPLRSWLPRAVGLAILGLISVAFCRMSWPALGDAHLIGALMVWGLLMASLTAGRHPALSLRFGVTALVFYVAISGAASQFEAFRNIAISDAASKTLVAAESSGLIGQRAGVLVTLLAFLTVCAVGVNARALVTGLGHASRRGSELARVGVYVLLALPYPLSGLKVGTQFLDLLLLKWTISSMESKGTYFMDTTPRTWDQLRDERFLKRLGGEEGRFAKQTPVEDLVGALSSDCVQEESAQEGWLDRPAHCVSPVQAQLYCESVGARLPTPAEWRDENASAGAEAPGGLGEWTMKQQHGVATFFRSNRDGATEVPVSVSERGVLFRCAVTF